MKNTKDNREFIMTLICYIIILSLLIYCFYLVLRSPSIDKYTFVLNGEQINEIMKCENNWNYNSSIFIPCILNKTVPVVLFNNSFDYSLSPIDNCAKWNATFPGFSINQTKAKELYDSIMPKCFMINSSNVDKYFETEQCKEIKKGGCVVYLDENLTVKKVSWKKNI